MTTGLFMILPDCVPKWLRKRLMPKLRARPQDCCDYELPPSRLIPNRLPITRPSTPCSPQATEPGSAGSSVDHSSAPETPNQTPLLEALHLELRQKIWLLILGGQTLHPCVQGDIYPRSEQNRLKAAYCLSASPDTCYGRCQCLGWKRDENGYHVPIVAEYIWGPLSLLTACRQVYTEAIDIFYSSDFFAINGAQTLEYLPLTIVPQRLNTIRTLRLICNFAGLPPCDMHIWGKGTEENLRVPLKRQEKWLST